MTGHFCPFPLPSPPVDITPPSSYHGFPARGRQEGSRKSCPPVDVWLPRLISCYGRPRRSGPCPTTLGGLGEALLGAGSMVVLCLCANVRNMCGYSGRPCPQPLLDTFLFLFWPAFWGESHPFPLPTCVGPTCRHTFSLMDTACCCSRSGCPYGELEMIGMVKLVSCGISCCVRVGGLGRGRDEIRVEVDGGGRWLVCTCSGGVGGGVVAENG